ncbi:WhiB family transcriptional regulator [Streptomyces sp. NPDC006879]|uniref:WhiB family transcriptional regulator n=1 Tax=Streptomyces sp. NPDC006879 TaxID=3364767 RepID=UPI0036B08927
MDRPTTDELVIRYRLISLRALRALREVDYAGAACTRTDPEAFSPQASPLRDQPNRGERQALRVCAGCPVQDLCLVRGVREAKSVFDLKGVRAGLRQSEQRALYLELQRLELL